MIQAPHTFRQNNHTELFKFYDKYTILHMCKNKFLQCIIADIRILYYAKINQFVNCSTVKNEIETMDLIYNAWKQVE